MEATLMPEKDLKATNLLHMAVFNAGRAVCSLAELSYSHAAHGGRRVFEDAACAHRELRRVLEALDAFGAEIKREEYDL